MTVYRPLSTSPTSPLSDEDDRPRPSKWLSTTTIALVVCIACTVINAIFSLRLELSLRARTTPSSPSYTDINLLRRPSQFIRFDEIERPSPPVPRQFNNYPILMTQVDKSHPEKVFEDDVRRYMARIGTISPKESRMLVTNTISTIVQFRAIDYGMERCELYLALPPTSNSTTADGSVALTIRRLNTTTPFDVRTLAFSNLPPHTSKVGDVALSGVADDTWRRSFFCSTEEVLSFELSCSLTTTAKDGCNVEWWQNVKKPNPGLYIVQHSTI